MALNSKRQYQPTIVRIPSLLGLLVLTLVLIALAELACRRLPVHSSNGLAASLTEADPERINAIIQARHAKRQLNGTDVVGGSGDGPTGDDPETTNPGAPAPGNFLPVSETVNPSSAPAPVDFLPVTSSIPAPAPSPVDFLPVTDTPFPTNAPAPSNFIPVSLNLNPTTKPTLTAIIDPGTSTDPDNSYVPTAPQAPAPNNFLPVTTSISTTLPATTTLPVPSSNGSETAAYITGTAGGVTYTLGPGGIVDVEGGVFSTSVPTTTILADGSTLIVGPTGAVSIEGPTQPEIAISDRDYVLGAFIPTILAVLFSIPWHILAAAIREMEPFYQLNRPEGVPSRASLTLDYRASINIIASFNALRKGHFLVWWSGLVSVVILFIAPLASDAIFIGFTGGASCTGTSVRVGCVSPTLSVFPPAARAIQGILAFVAVMTLGLAIALWRKRSGTYANPLSIAGLATLFQHPPLVDKFRQIPSISPDSKQLAKALQGSTYRIGPYVEMDGSTRYGMHLLESHAEPSETEHRRSSSLGGKRYTSVNEQAIDELQAPPKQKRTISGFGTHPIVLIGFCLFICGLLALIVYYNRVGADTPFERFMDSDSFGTSFLFTAVGVIIKLYWTLLDDDTRSNEPYRQLAQGSAPPRDSILLSPGSNPFYGVFYSLRHGHFFNAYISLVAILCEALIVCLANVPFKPGHSFTGYTVCTWLAVAILLTMLVGVVWKLGRKSVSGVRRPDTIAGMLVQICGSHILGDFEGMAELDTRMRNKAVVGWGKRYSMGMLIGVDGVQRAGVDEAIFFRGGTAMAM